VKQIEIQLQLLRSPRYEPFYNHMIEVWHQKPNDVFRLIERDFKWLLDVNYVGTIVKKKGDL
jgi:hypothetical protein